MSPPKKALIIGSGVAGPAVALFLKRAGFHAEVYEARSAAERDAGFFLNLAPNGMNILKTLGLDRLLEQRGIPASGFAFYNRKGTPIGMLDHRLDRERYGVQSLVVKRAELHAVLRGAARQHAIPVFFDKKFSRLEGLEQGVVAHFEDGTRAQGDLLICCDGIYSRTRRLLFPDSPSPSYLGTVNCSGFARLPELGGLSGPQVMTFGKRAFFGHIVRPSGEVYWFSNVPWSKEPDRDERSAHADDAWKARLLELHADDPDPIARIIHATPAGEIGRWPLRDLSALPVWHKGLVCMVGDAAHATSPSAGQGASMALEDAAVLGKCLRDVPETETAFATFQRLRQARVEGVIRQSRGNGVRSVPRPVTSWARDLALPLLLKLGTRAASRTYAYEVAWDEQVRVQGQAAAHSAR